MHYIKITTFDGNTEEHEVKCKCKIPKRVMEIIDNCEVESVLITLGRGEK